MDAPAAVLLDVYETVLTCDFERHVHGLAEAAGVTWDAWSPALEQLVPDLVRGRLKIVEASVIDRTGWGTATGATVRSLAELDAAVTG